MSLSAPGEIQIQQQEKFLYGKDLKALEQSAQGRCEVTIPGNAQKMCGYGTRGHGLIVNGDAKLMVGLDNLKDLF